MYSMTHCGNSGCKAVYNKSLLIQSGRKNITEIYLIQSLMQHNRFF